MLRLSKYTLCFESKDQCYVFNSETLFFSKISKELYVSLLNRDWDAIQEDMEFLKLKRVIVDDNEIDQYYYNTLTEFIRDSYASKRLPLIIVPTTCCNFACPYCFEPKKVQKSISQEVEDAIINYIKMQKDKSMLELIWYGGEPLLRLDIMQRLYARILDECSKDIKSHKIITNGYLINKSVIKFCSKNNVTHVQVTLDGVKQNHDSTRFSKVNKGATFEQISANIETLAKALPALKIHLRVNIDKNNWSDFADLYNYYNSANWGKNVYLYPGILRKESKDNYRYCYSCIDTTDIFDLYSKFSKMGINVNFFPKLLSKGCMIQRPDSFIIGPEGELYKCMGDVSNPDKVVGNIKELRITNSKLMHRFQYELIPFDDNCKKCHVFPICDGGCGALRYRNRFENGEFNYCSPYKDPSILSKSLLKSSVSNNAKNEKNISF